MSKFMFTLALSLMMFIGSLNASESIIENAENGTTSNWMIFDKEPSGAMISSVYDTERSSQVIKLDSEGVKNGYMIGYPGGWGNSKSWNNEVDKKIKWSMKFSEDYIIYVSVQTPKGHRLLAYSESDSDKGISYGIIHHGLGQRSRDGRWHTITRDLQADLVEFEADNNITSVNAFQIRGSGCLDDIVLFNNDTLENQNSISLSNLMSVTNDSNISKKIKILGIGSGGSHHLLFHHSDGKTVIEDGDMGAMSISHDGGKTFQQLVSNEHAKDVDHLNRYSLPRLLSIVEHPTYPDWLLGVGTYGVVSFSIDRGKTWQSKDVFGNNLMTNKIVVRKEGRKVIAYFASGYKLGKTNKFFPNLATWVDITHMNYGVKYMNYGFIHNDSNSVTGYNGKYYYGDIASLGSEKKLFIGGKGGLFVCEGDNPKDDASWKNITDSLFVHKKNVFPIDNIVTIGDKLYVLAFGDSNDTNGTAGVYVHKKGEMLSNGKYKFTRITKGLNFNRFKYAKEHNNQMAMFNRESGGLLEHKDTSNNKTYLYLIMQDVIYRLNVTDNSDEFERVIENVESDGNIYSKGFILGQRDTEHWSKPDYGSYTSFTESEEFGKMPFATSYYPSFAGLNAVYSYGGKIYVSNTIEVKVSSDNGKTFDSYTSQVSNSDSKYDGKIKNYYGTIGLYRENNKLDYNPLPITPTDDSSSFWWSGVKNVGMDNMVSTDIAINPNNPKEIMQTYMDSAAFFSNDSGESWHYVAGLKGLLGDIYWTLCINGDFYAQDQIGIYKFDKNALEFKRLRDIDIVMYMYEGVRVRRYYDKKSDTLIVAGYIGDDTKTNTIAVIKNFTNDNLREQINITDSRVRDVANGIDFLDSRGESRSFKDIYCDGHYIYAINAEFGVIKMPLDNLPIHYNDNAFGLDTNEYVYSGLFDKKGNALLVTETIDKSKGEFYYTDRYLKAKYYQSLRLKKINTTTESGETIVSRGDGLTIDGKDGVISKKGMLVLLGIDPKNSKRVLASISDTHTTIESIDGGSTWKEFIPQISGNAHSSQASNALFAPSSSIYDVIILGTGSAYGVLK